MVEEVILHIFPFFFLIYLFILIFCVNYHQNEFIYFAEGDVISK